MSIVTFCFKSGKEIKCKIKAKEVHIEDFFDKADNGFFSFDDEYNKKWCIRIKDVCAISTEKCE